MRCHPQHRTLPLVALIMSAILPLSASAATAKARKPLPAIDKANWIWGDMESDVCQFRLELSLDATPTTASILITADNGYELFVNGGAVGHDVGAAANIWSSVERYDMKKRLAQGRNIIGIRGICLGGMRGLVAAVRVEMADRKPLELVTDSSWHVALKGKPEDYSHPEFLEDEGWTAAKILGKMGMAPWGKLAFGGSKGGRRHGRLPAAVAFGEPGDDLSGPARSLSSAKTVASTHRCAGKPGASASGLATGRGPTPNSTCLVPPKSAANCSCWTPARRERSRVCSWTPARASSGPPHPTTTARRSTSRWRPKGTPSFTSIASRSRAGRPFV